MRTRKPLLQRVATLKAMLQRHGQNRRINQRIVDIVRRAGAAGIHSGDIWLNVGATAEDMERTLQRLVRSGVLITATQRRDIVPQRDVEWYFHRNFDPAEGLGI